MRLLLTFLDSQHLRLKELRQKEQQLLHRLAEMQGSTEFHRASPPGSQLGVQEMNSLLGLMGGTSTPRR